MASLTWFARLTSGRCRRSSWLPETHLGFTPQVSSRIMRRPSALANAATASPRRTARGRPGFLAVPLHHGCAGRCTRCRTHFCWLAALREHCDRHVPSWVPTAGFLPHLLFPFLLWLCVNVGRKRLRWSAEQSGYCPIGSAPGSVPVARRRVVPAARDRAVCRRVGPPRNPSSLEFAERPRHRRVCTHVSRRRSRHGVWAVRSAQRCPARHLGWHPWHFPRKTEGCP